MRNGHIKRITDQDIQSSVLEIMGTNVSTNYITCPAEAKKTLGIKLPFLVMIIKNVSRCWSRKATVEVERGGAGWYPYLSQQQRRRTVIASACASAFRLLMSAD